MSYFFSLLFISCRMRGIMSEGMVMCGSSPEKVEIIDPPAGSVPGDRVFCPGYEGITTIHVICHGFRRWLGASLMRVYSHPQGALPTSRS